MTADANSGYGNDPPCQANQNNGGVPSLHNKWLENSADDHMYHFGISKNETSVVSKFTNIKFVCTGGSASRIYKFAEMFSKNNQVPISPNLSKTDRFAMYITGPVLWINHGMGVPSLSIMLVECIKLLHYAKAVNVKFIRMGTSGAVGVDPGTLVVSTGAMNGLFQNKHVQHINGKVVEHDAILDEDLGNKLFEAAESLELPIQRGITLCADDFYEGQMRLDGLFCDFRKEDKVEFLRKIHELGVRNIEMESTGFAAFTHRAKIPAAVLCIAIVDRMVSDQVRLDSTVYREFEMRPFHVVSALIKTECVNMLSE